MKILQIAVSINPFILVTDHKRKILAQIGKAFEAQHGKKPKAGQLRNLITAKHRVGYRLNLSTSEVRVVK
ncbi:MAG: hypothetical protein HY203_05490 [Nitrospirae bacterium]|nr:hypothetical protein [Nitrospirota bacterium]